MKTLLIISVFCLTGLVNVFGQEKSQEMLNKAIYQEEVNGNLEEAIILFKKIVDDESTNRTIKVSALYHLGLANEKLGNKIAKEYYEQVVSNYGDKPETVQLAKSRLQYLNSQTLAKNQTDTKINSQIIHYCF